MLKLANINAQMREAKALVTSFAVGTPQRAEAVDGYNMTLDTNQPWLERLDRPLDPEVELSEHEMLEDYVLFKAQYNAEGPLCTFVRDFRRARAVAMIQIDAIPAAGEVAFTSRQVFKGPLSRPSTAGMVIDRWSHLPAVAFEVHDVILAILYPREWEGRKDWRFERGGRILFKEIDGVPTLISRPEALDYWSGFDYRRMPPHYIHLPPVSVDADEIMVRWDPVKAWMLDEVAGN